MTDTSQRQTQSNRKTKIIWSVDAFDESNDVFTQSVQFLKEMAKALPADIQPVYILSPEQLNVAAEFSAPFTERYLPAAEKALVQKLKGLEIPNLLPSKVLVHHKFSLRGSAEALFAYALAEKAESIVVGSHGRKGLDRILIGSFAEELLLHSQIPVTVVGQNSQKISAPIRRILFPTDFGPGSSEAFSRVLDLAEKLQAKLSVLHCIPRAIEPVFQSGVYMLSGGWVPFPEYQEKELLKQNHVAKAWQEKALAHDVIVDWTMDTDCTSITQSILDHTQSKKPGMIAMAAQSKRVASALLGSITRQVVRQAPVPIWVLRLDS